MKKALFAAFAITVLLALFGCGSSGPPPSFEAKILSDFKVDGDIEFAPPNTFTFTQAFLDNTQSVQFGVDPATGLETRAFLSFPLGKVPGNAIIDSATLDVFINNFQSLSGIIPIRIDLVDLLSTAQPQVLQSGDFSQAALASTTISLPVSAIPSTGRVLLDVTTLMDEAQVSHLGSFQVRISRDTLGIVELDDPTTTASTAPLLDVIFH